MITTTDKKRCALECASVEEVAHAAGPVGSTHAPCVLLDPLAEPLTSTQHSTEDESADPVGDGHSDADLAARLPPQP